MENLKKDINEIELFFDAHEYYLCNAINNLIVDYESDKEKHLTKKAMLEEERSLIIRLIHRFLTNDKNIVYYCKFENFLEKEGYSHYSNGLREMAESTIMNETMKKNYGNEVEQYNYKTVLPLIIAEKEEELKNRLNSYTGTNKELSALIDMLRNEGLLSQPHSV